MTKNNDIKNTETDDKPIEPYVNVKLKLYLIAAVVIMCAVTAIAVLLSPEAKEQRRIRKQTVRSDIVYTHLDT